MLQVSDDHFQEVVGFARDEVTRNHLGHGRDRFLELDGALVGVTVDLHTKEDRETKSDPFPSQYGSIGSRPKRR
jgi:hypothetical protein